MSAGLTVICGLCGTLTAGEEAGDRVKWAHCRECRDVHADPEAP